MGGRRSASIVEGHLPPEPVLEKCETSPDSLTIAQEPVGAAIDSTVDSKSFAAGKNDAGLGLRGELEMSKIIFEEDFDI